MKRLHISVPDELDAWLTKYCQRKMHKKSPLIVRLISKLKEKDENSGFTKVPADWKSQLQTDEERRERLDDYDKT